MNNNKLLNKIADLEEIIVNNSEELQKLKNMIESDTRKVDDIDSYENACTILQEDYSVSTSIEEQLRTIIRAANYLDNNNKEYKPDFNNKNVIKYLPYLTKSSGAWSLNIVFECYFDSFCPAWLYFKEESTAKLIVSKFLKSHYSKVWG